MAPSPMYNATNIGKIINIAKLLFQKVLLATLYFYSIYIR